eukprot:TRINITY_DN16652_c0_g1_i1.p1 TRINITY_DN16652_c0_g1~~TRINITY_DN16652_c0_g1_i1.p1  ORF type:complete len:576 (+),score=240.90 TRINITY_DN16652_c0_g1_i1:158-1885(+)
MAKKVGDYVLGNVIGTGGFSKVKKAVASGTNKVVAVKIIDANKYKTPEKEEWLRREVAVLRRLDHPNIVELIEVLQVADRIYIVLEYVDGGELLTAVSKVRRLFEDEARTYFHQLIDGVAYMHALGIVHRDLKPENLLLTKFGKLKIADFGLANIVPKTNNHFQLLSTIVGSPDYCAPEVIQEKNYNGFKADVYSCGTILFTMITGQRPFESATPAQTISRVKEGLYMVPRHVSAECDSIIRAMMEMDPEKRYDTEQVQSDPWFTVNYHKPALPAPTADAMKRELTEEEIRGSIQKVELQKATGNAFSLIAGLQAGSVDQLVGKANDVKLLLTVKEMEPAFARVASLLRTLKCKIQERRQQGDGNSGKLVLFAYVTLHSGVLTFTAELQARPPALVSLTFSLERGDDFSFQALCSVISANLCDLFEQHHLRLVKSSNAKAVPNATAPEAADAAPAAPTLTASLISETTHTFAVTASLPCAVLVAKCYDALVQLSAWPVLLEDRSRDPAQLRIKGFITPDSGLLTYSVMFSAADDTSKAEVKQFLGKPAVFAEFRAAFTETLRRLCGGAASSQPAS